VFRLINRAHTPREHTCNLQFVGSPAVADSCTRTRAGSLIVFYAHTHARNHVQHPSLVVVVVNEIESGLRTGAAGSTRRCFATLCGAVVLCTPRVHARVQLQELHIPMRDAHAPT
jgi:hypothetical protein